MSEKHQIALVSTNSCDSGVSGLSQSMAIAITITPTRNVSLESNGDDVSRMDCCDTTASSVSMSDHESSEEGEEVVHDASQTIGSASCQRRLFQKQSSWNSSKDSSKDSSKGSSKGSSKPKKSHFLRPQFKLANDVPSITDSSTSTKEAESKSSNGNSNSNNTSERLFQDQMDIVAFQEWPPQRRQPNQHRRYRYHRNHHSHNFHQYPLHHHHHHHNHIGSPSVTSFSVETIATKLGRSPVVVSFDDVDLVHPPVPLELAAPIALAGRIPTGRFPQPFSEEDSCRSTGRPASCSDLMADSIFKTIRSMMCTNNNNNNNNTLPCTTTTSNKHDKKRKRARLSEGHDKIISSSKKQSYGKDSRTATKYNHSKPRLSLQSHASFSRATSAYSTIQKANCKTTKSVSKIQPTKKKPLLDVYRSEVEKARKFMDEMVGLKDCRNDNDNKNDCKSDKKTPRSSLPAKV
mmetsp:Transcript_19033/g.47280  ORF Transcript_19033/g.47280 Transcript_19033/m.47280 type:complete len:462 (-) Transcript_19033:657-2042(-)